MNVQEIYKQRIADSSSDYVSSLALPEGDNRVIHSIDFCNGATFALQNQWISVEEALPEFEGNFSDDCLIRTEKGWCDVTQYYKTSEKEYWWNFEKVKVTHWMPIQQLEGGEK